MKTAGAGVSCKGHWTARWRSWEQAAVDVLCKVAPPGSVEPLPCNVGTTAAPYIAQEGCQHHSDRVWKGTAMSSHAPFSSHHLPVLRVAGCLGESRRPPRGGWSGPPWSTFLSCTHQLPWLQNSWNWTVIESISSDLSWTGFCICSSKSIF